MPDRSNYDRYVAATHAMQTGVAYKMEYDAGETQPKQLRVGVNSALVSIAALTELLINKGVITFDEYEAATADRMESEAEAYQKWLADWLGTNVTLG